MAESLLTVTGARNGLPRARHQRDDQIHEASDLVEVIMISWSHHDPAPRHVGSSRYSDVSFVGIGVRSLTRPRSLWTVLSVPDNRVP